MFPKRARPSLLLVYVHKTIVIYWIWDFDGRGRALESSNNRFLEQEIAWTTTQREFAHVSDKSSEEIYPPESEHEEAPDTITESAYLCGILVNRQLARRTYCHGVLENPQHAREYL